MAVLIMPKDILDRALGLTGHQLSGHLGCTKAELLNAATESIKATQFQYQWGARNDRSRWDTWYDESQFKERAGGTFDGEELREALFKLTVFIIEVTNCSQHLQNPTLQMCLYGGEWCLVAREPGQQVAAPNFIGVFPLS